MPPKDKPYPKQSHAAIKAMIQKSSKDRDEQPRQKDIIESIQDGRSARSELDIWRARRIMREEMIAAGELVWRDQVEEATAMLWEMVGNDLRYTLPGEIADRMPNAAAARAALKASREAVEQVIESWKKAGAEIECSGSEVKTEKPKSRIRKKQRP